MTNTEAGAERLAEGGPIMPRRRRSVEALLLGVVLVYAAVLWTAGVGRLNIDRSMEASRALVAQQMIRSGDWVVPRRGSAIYLAKPPLFYWTAAALSHVAGEVTASTVRGASALSALLVLLVLYFAVRSVLGPPAGLLAAVAGATCPLAFSGATSGLVNMMLALGVTLAILGTFFLLESPEHKWRHGFVCALGLSIGLLTKGPIVLLFLAPTLLPWIGFVRGGRLTRSRRVSALWFAAAAAIVWIVSVVTPRVGPAAATLYLVPLGMVLYFAFHGPSGFGRSRAWLLVLAATLVLVLPWPILLAERLGVGPLLTTLKNEFWRERLVTIDHSNRGPIWIYAGYFPAAVMPWMLLLPLAFVPGRGTGGSPRRDRFVLLAKCWLIGSLVLFTVVGESRKMRYVIPVFPAVAILVAEVMMRARAGEFGLRATRYFRRLGRLSVPVLAASPLVLAVVWLAVGLRPSVAFAALVATPLAGLAIVTWLFRLGRRAAIPLVAVASVFLGAKVFLNYGQADLYNARHPIRSTCERLLSHVPAGEAVRLLDMPSVPAAFYLRALPYDTLDGDPAALEAKRTLFVCTGVKASRTFEPPSGFRSTEVDRAGRSDEVFVLFRLEREPGGRR